MGIAQADLRLLIELKKLGLIRTRSSVIEIGAQQLTNSFMTDREGIEEIAGLFEVSDPFPFLQPPKDSWSSRSVENVVPESPLSRCFWNWLRFRYAALDIDGSEDSLPLDLNFDSVPQGARGQFEVVTNFGTTEHVANQINAFKMIHDFCCHNGLMIHNVPGYGMLDHGLITYNPKFFWMLGRSNGYKIVFMNYQLNDVPYSIPGDIVDYLQGFNSTVSHERLRSRKLIDGSLVVVMQKQFDIEFVPPIDTNTGAPAPTPEIKERYWTVFEPDAFEKLCR
ncbi:MAG TPA: hypothetical protein V6D22_18420 [Candidatus Obscuribacterales bacterium]